MYVSASAAFPLYDVSHTLREQNPSAFDLHGVSTALISAWRK
jgi:hypothetical protein